MRNNINLLPPRPKIRRSLGPAVLLMIIIGALVLASLSGIYSYRRLAIIRTQERTAEIRKSIELIRPDVQAVSNVEARTLEIKKLYDEVIALEDAHLSPAMFLSVLKSRMPADVWLTNASVSALEIVTINGITRGYQSVARSVLSLEASDALKGMRIDTVTSSKDAGTEAIYEGFVLLGNLERRR